MNEFERRVDLIRSADAVFISMASMHLCGPLVSSYNDASLVKMAEDRQTIVIVQL